MLFVLISHLFVLCCVVLSCVVVSFQVCAAHSDQLDFLGQDHRRGRRPEEDDRQHPIPHQVNGRAKINQYYKKKSIHGAFYICSQGCMPYREWVKKTLRDLEVEL